MLKNIKLDIKNKEILYFALNNLVKNKIIFKGKKNREGYLIYKSNHYIFQPDDIKDEKILTEERTKKKITKENFNYFKSNILNSRTAGKSKQIV